MKNRMCDDKLTPLQLEQRASQRRDAAKLLPPGRVRTIVLQEADRDAELAAEKRKSEVTNGLMFFLER